MSGAKFLLDTNSVIALLNGNQKVVQILSNANWIGVSVISTIEFLSFPKLTKADKDTFYQFLEKIEVLPLSKTDEDLIEQISKIRIQHKLKLPDAIIAAKAMQHKATLISADKDFKRIEKLNWVSF
jgi:predicted nucleic acid-binding protein